MRARLGYLTWPVTIPPASASCRRRLASGGPSPSAPCAGDSNSVRVLAPVRDVHDDRVRPAEQHRPQPLGRLVVEDPLPPVAGDVLGDDHEGDRRVLVRRPGRVEHVEVGEQRADERPVGRLDDDQRHARDLALPAVAHARRPSRVVGDVDRPDVVADRAPDVDRLDDGPVEARDRDDDPLLAVRAAGRRGPGRTASSRAERRVLALDEQHHRDEDAG